MTPEVSVLIPLYNSETYIRQAIESILEQSFRAFEIIVADDGSTDGGGQIAASFPEVRYFKREHAGIPETRNFALSKARGDLITFIDSDDLWAKDKLALQVQYMKEHPDCEIVFSRYQNFYDGTSEEPGSRQKQILPVEIPQFLPSACVRRSLFEQFGGYDEAYAFGEDTQWLARLEVAGADLSHKIDQVLYFRRIHDHNISLTHHNMSEEQRYSIMADAIRRKWKRERDI